MAEDKKRVKKTMTQQEKEDFDALYQYVRCNVMEYDQNQSLSASMTLRLKGLQTNKFIDNRNTRDTANYPFSVILNTFKYCSPDIQRVLKTVSFRDENHKFNYILKIVSDNLNTVYMRMKNAKKADEKLDVIDLNHLNYKGAGYHLEQEECLEELNDLW